MQEKFVKWNLDISRTKLLVHLHQFAMMMGIGNTQAIFVAQHMVGCIDMMCEHMHELLRCDVHTKHAEECEGKK